MKKRNVLVAICAIMMLSTGCSTQGETTFSVASTQVANTSISESTSESPSSKNDVMTEKESTISGTISDIKDFMFVITDENGVDYALDFEGEKPEGLSNVKDGDKVSVIYTGTLEQTEAFTGNIISVTKK